MESVWGDIRFLLLFLFLKQPFLQVLVSTTDPIWCIQITFNNRLLSVFWVFFFQIVTFKTIMVSLVFLF